MKILSVGGLVGISGCSALANTKNCTHAYRDITIGEIKQDDQDALFNLAGKITRNPSNQDWFLFSDGTGVAKVYPTSGSDEDFSTIVAEECIQITARVGNVFDAKNVDISMYIGKLVSVETTANSSS